MSIFKTDVNFFSQTQSALVCLMKSFDGKTRHLSYRVKGLFIVESALIAYPASLQVHSSQILRNK